MARRTTALETETFPEADRLEGFPHPRETAKLFGHGEAQAEFASAFASGRLHHGWIVTGAEGIGKATLAYQLARYVLSADQERSWSDDQGIGYREGSTADRQVRSLSHPALLVIRRSYDIRNKRLPTQISVDEVRRLKGFLTHKAGNDAWRVVIVDRTEELTLNAANALLKSLEEPPPRAVFLLVAAEPGRLLATIRSRCRLLPLQPLANEELVPAATQAVAESDLDLEVTGDDAQMLAAAGGSVRRFLELSSGDGGEISSFVDRLLAAGGRPDWQARHALAERLAATAAQQNYEMFFHVLFERLGRLIRVRAGGSGSEAERQRSMQLISPDGLATWVDLWETLQREKLDIQTLNLDRASFLLDAMARIDEAAARGART
ncbi:MAG: DNA polymerase III subunit delta' [Hyphomicrobiaceae bacterium]